VPHRRTVSGRQVSFYLGIYREYLPPEATLIVSEGHDRDWVPRVLLVSAITRQIIQATSAGDGGLGKMEEADRE